VASIRVRKRYKQSMLVEMVLDEGRNREIRRVLARVGHKVLRLVRVAIGPVRLGELPRGGSRKLTEQEVAALYRAATARP
jgi:23S rRNA pseudouridine2605 synthase